MKENKKDGSLKRVIKRILKVTFIGICVIVALTLILSVGTYLYRSCLDKEANLIHHKGQYVEVDGHEMNLLIEGDGDKTLVFLAGAGTPSPILDFKPLTDRLKEDVKVVIIEKFGYGYSDEIEGDRTVDIITEQDREALLAAGVEGTYILCPYSASGFEAMYWANHYPDEVEAIIGLDMGIPEEYDYMGVDWASLQPEDPEEGYFGYGVWIIDNPDGEDTVYMQGCDDGVSAIAEYNPNNGMISAALSNYGDNVWKLMRDIRKEYY